MNPIQKSFTKITNPLKVIHRNLPADLLSETLNRPWMRMNVFLDRGPLSRTPEHYKKFYYDWKVKWPENPAHYKKKEAEWAINDRGEVNQTEDTHILLKIPLELHQGLWGGEAVIRGFQKRSKKRYMVPHFWMPRLQETVVYSEILDRLMNVVVTERALNLIDEHYGLDYYILQTSPADLMSELALRLRREMYLKLLGKSLYPEDPVKNDEIYDKYKQYMIPHEEADWYGLKLSDAFKKQRKEEQDNDIIGPYKAIFRKEYIEHLRASRDQREASGGEEEKVSKFKSLLSSVNIFGKK